MFEKMAKYAKEHFENNLLGDSVINFIRIRGIDEKLLSRGIYKQYSQDVTQPSKEMVEAREFYRQNSDRVERIEHYLEDDESRKCYQKAIKYRYTHNMEEAPIYTKKRYFVDGIIELSTNEVFVDAGAFVGDTIRTFYKKTHGKYKKIIAFEPDQYNFQMLSKLKYKDVLKYNCGLWSSNDKLHFTNGGGCGSRMSEEGAAISVEVRRLDDIEECQEATFIKMDIEGSELQALKGATSIIKNKHPKLAICLYHSDEDMLDIIEYIHEIEPRYKLYVRHHSIAAAEDVVYAIYK